MTRIANRSEHLAQAVACARDNDGRVDLPPFQMDVEPTKACNLSCLFCSRNYWDESRNPKRHLAPELVQAILPLYRQCSVSGLQGLGEPFLAPGFFDLASLAKSLGIFTFVSSNCTLLSDRLCERILQCGLDHITLSIDGVASLPRVRGISFHGVEENVLRLLAHRRAAGSGTPRFYVETVLTLLNLDDLPDIVAAAKRFEAEKVLVYHPELYAPELARHSFYNDPGRCREVFERSRSLARDLGLELHLPDLDQAAPSTASTGDKRQNVTYCDYPFQYLMVANTGQVSPCCIGCLRDENGIEVGDLNRQSIEAIWNGEALRALRRDMLAHTPRGLCRACPMKGWSLETYRRHLNGK